MEYSDAENIRWWQGLTKGDRLALITEIAEKATSARVADSTCRAIEAIKANQVPEPRDIAQIRKWSHGR